MICFRLDVKVWGSSFGGWIVLGPWHGSLLDPCLVRLFGERKLIDADGSERYNSYKHEEQLTFTKFTFTSESVSVFFKLGFDWVATAQICSRKQKFSASIVCGVAYI